MEEGYRCFASCQEIICIYFFKYMGPKTSASLRLVTKLILKACVWLILLQEVAA